MTQKPKTPVFPTAMTEAVADVLAQTEFPGLSTSKLEGLLPGAKLSELDPGPNKRTRLLTTLNNAQIHRGSGATLAGADPATTSPTLNSEEPASLGRRSCRVPFYTDIDDGLPPSVETVAHALP